MQVYSQQGDHINIKTHSLSLKKLKKETYPMQIYSNQWQWILQVTWLLICILSFNLKNTIPVKKYQVLLNVFSKEIFRDVTGREIRIENFSDQTFACLKLYVFPFVTKTFNTTLIYRPHSLHPRKKLNPHQLHDTKKKYPFSGH